MSMKAADLILQLSEKELQQRIIDRARALGWLVYHTYNSRHSAAGFPDLVLARDGRVLFVEVKSEKGRLTKAQKEWLSVLYDEPWIGNPALQSEYDSHQVYVWRPSDIAEIEDVLA
jgi:Holliday junction resolvase